MLQKVNWDKNLHSSSSKIYNAEKIIDAYQKQQWTKYRALGNSTFDLFMLRKHTIDENSLVSIREMRFKPL